MPLPKSIYCNSPNTALKTLTIHVIIIAGAAKEEATAATQQQLQQYVPTTPSKGINKKIKKYRLKRRLYFLYTHYYPRNALCYHPSSSNSSFVCVWCVFAGQRERDSFRLWPDQKKKMFLLINIQSLIWQSPGYFCTFSNSTVLITWDFSAIKRPHNNLFPNQPIH